MNDTFRRLEPFGFYSAVSSAISGFGGEQPSDDPTYCFHTYYIQVPPGRARFHLNLRGAKSSCGEMTLRVLGLRPDGHAELVASLTIALDGVDVPELVAGLRFQAIEGVNYALYGFFSEPSDLLADAVEIALEESLPSAREAVRARAHSRIGADAKFTASPKLLGMDAPGLERLACQPFTMAQICDVGQTEWPGSVMRLADPEAQWRVIAPYCMLAHAGVLVPGAKGAVLNADGPELAKMLEQAGCFVETFEWDPMVDSQGGQHPLYGQLDFVIGFDARNQAGQVGERPFAVDMMDWLAFEGLGVVVGSFPGTTDFWSVANRMKQIALRLIGHRHHVAQMALPLEGRWFDPRDGRSFLMVAKC